MRVLIADERQSVRAALRAVLEHDPQCDGIDEAIESGGALAALGFGADVMIVEWGLPGLPPAALVSLARERQPGLIIIVLGHLAGARESALNAGADHFIETAEPAHEFLQLLHGLCRTLHEKRAPHPAG